MAKIEGTIGVTGLPPHCGLIVNLCFFSVTAADAPAPYGGDPPAEAVTDSHQVAKQVDLHTESSQSGYDLPFAAERPAGYYYLQVRAISGLGVRRLLAPALGRLRGEVRG